jgi:hypothetical protein
LGTVTPLSWDAHLTALVGTTMNESDPDADTVELLVDELTAGLGKAR